MSERRAFVMVHYPLYCWVLGLLIVHQVGITVRAKPAMMEDYDSPVIYSGTKVRDRTLAPWMVYLQLDVRIAGRSMNCAGSLISNRIILTAAHCVTYQCADSGETITGKGVRYFLGTLSTVFDGRDGSGVIVAEQRDMINGLKVHPEYVRHPPKNDLALVKMGDSGGPVVTQLGEAAVQVGVVSFGEDNACSGTRASDGNQDGEILLRRPMTSAAGVLGPAIASGTGSSIQSAYLAAATARRDCNVFAPSVEMKVSAYRDWIDSEADKLVQAG
ncbi:unnamed protein product [Notodromas monacha]|uniref:Peptidase S1 domain-containing protein n=1 Tax=Notodromas monacha TaxID=399045 RepID=A0A7R9BF25_9CRUS|nr:unnamed protein product [Notodromas monacha]CAG0912933.1 unnamed protein product [Notodromas monacha]